MHLRHRPDQLLALRFGERLEYSLRGAVRPTVHLVDFGASLPRETRAPYSIVARADAKPNESLGFEGLDDAAQISGVEPEARAKVTEFGAIVSDLEQHARLAEWPVAAEEVLIERAGPLRNESIEPPDLVDLIGKHCLT
jgi:hypothetical protein